VVVNPDHFVVCHSSRFLPFPPILFLRPGLFRPLAFTSSHPHSGEGVDLFRHEDVCPRPSSSREREP
jgi:hypothetical protein